MKEEDGPHIPGHAVWVAGHHVCGFRLFEFAKTQVHLLGCPLAKAWETKGDIPFMEVYSSQSASHSTSRDCKQEV